MFWGKKKYVVKNKGLFIKKDNSVYIYVNTMQEATLFNIKEALNIHSGRTGVTVHEVIKASGKAVGYCDLAT